MVAAFDHCLFGRGRCRAVDRHRDARSRRRRPTSTTSTPTRGIAFATAADGEALTRECFGDRVAWVAVAAARLPARASTSPRSAREQPERDRRRSSAATGSRRGATRSEECEANSLEIIRHGRAVHRRARPAGAVRADRARVTSRSAGRRAPGAGRRPPAARPRPRLDRPAAGRPLHRQRRRARLPRAGRRIPRLAALGTSCPDHFLRTKVRPLVLDLPPLGAARGREARLRELHAAVPRRLRAPTTSGTRRPTARRCAAPIRRSCSCRASACSASAPTKQTARVAGEFYVNAINVMRGAEALSTYAPIPESEKFRIEYWALEEAKLAAAAAAEAARRRASRS